MAVEVPAQVGIFGKVKKKVESEIPVDHAAFKDPDSGDVVLEVYYQIYNYFFKFKPDGDRFRADYLLDIKVFDKKKNVAGSESKDKSIIVNSIEKTKSLSDFRTSQTTFRMSPGKYRVELTLTDNHSRQVMTREFDINLSGFENKKPTMSDIEFVRAAGPLDNEASVFAKGNLVVIPSVTRRFGGVDEGNHLRYYMEIYRGADSSEEVLVVSLLRNKSRGKMVYRDSVTVALDRPRVMQVRDISLDEVPPGDYDLEVQLRGRRNKKLFEKRAKFSVTMTLDAFLKHDFETVLSQLAYVAESEEIDSLEMIEGMTERIKAFNAFWRKRDPTPGTGANEQKSEFYRRVQFANERFSFMRRNGWRTDRGRIYIMFGEPDQLDDYPYTPNTHPYQEWHYYRQGRYRKFVFVDENEDGEFRLVYPYDGLYMRPDF
jgi:GWxTD domain-containing protein